MITFLLSLVVFYFLFKKQYNIYLGLSFAFICFAPPFEVGGITLNYGGYLVLFGGAIHFLYLIAYNRVRMSNKKLYCYNFIFLLLFFLSLVITAFSKEAETVAITKPLVALFFLFSINYYVYFIDGEKGIAIIEVIKVFCVVAVPLNFVVVVGQLVAPELFTQFVIDNYYGDFRSRGEGSTLEWYGYFHRATGLTYTPVLLGSLSLLLFFLGFFFRLKLRAMYLLVVTFMGVMAFSKTFFLGLVFTCLYFAKDLVKSIPRIYVLSLILLLISIQLGNTFLNFEFGGNFSDRFLSFLSLEGSISDAFSSRYSTDEDILFSGTYEKIAERPIVGWGYLADNSVFLGDSSYVVTLYRNGVIGLLCLLFMIAFVFFNSGKMPKMLLLLISLIGFGTMTIDNMYYLPFWVLILSNKSDNVIWSKLT